MSKKDLMDEIELERQADELAEAASRLAHKQVRAVRQIVQAYRGPFIIPAPLGVYTWQFSREGREWDGGYQNFTAKAKRISIGSDSNSLDVSFSPKDEGTFWPHKMTFAEFLGLYPGGLRGLLAAIEEKIEKDGADLVRDPLQF